MLEQLAVYDGPVYTGSAAMALYAGALGCTGPAILAAANLEPEIAAKAFGGDVAAQRALLDAHSDYTLSSTRPTASSVACTPGTARHRTAATIMRRRPPLRRCRLVGFWGLARPLRARWCAEKLVLPSGHEWTGRRGLIGAWHRPH